MDVAGAMMAVSDLASESVPAFTLTSLGNRPSGEVPGAKLEARWGPALASGPPVVTGPPNSIVSLPKLLRFVFRGDLGRLLVRLALVALIKLELAALRKGVGKARSILCE